MWAVLALAMLAAVLVIGSGTGGNANVGGTTSNLVLPLALLRMRRLSVVPAPRS